MSKRYIHTIDDDTIEDAAGLKAVADENPLQYPVGGLYVAANGVLLQVTANDGSAVTVGTVTVA